MAERIDPRVLLTAERLDIAVKWRFLRHLLRGSDPDSERLYRWHIEKRTGGREPRSWKRSVEDYVTACRVLLKEMQRLEFNPRFPLEYGRNGRLRNGAHRMACSLLLGLDAYRYVVASDGNATWGEDWFLRHGIAREDLKRIKADWVCLKEPSS